MSQSNVLATNEQNIIEESDVAEFPERIRTANNKKVGGDLFDLVKLVLAVFVFILHAHALHLGGIPVLRIAVPLFFMITSYFFFSKYDHEVNPDAKKAILRKYLVRNVALYLIWTIVEIYYILQIRTWFQHPFPEDILYLLRSVLFGSTFKASWFISACVIATSILTAISKKGVNAATVIIAVICFLMGVFSTNYRYVFPCLDKFLNGYFKLFCSPECSFVIAIAWVSLGRFFANRDIKTNTGLLWAIAFLSLISLYFEYFAVKHFELWSKHDVYFSLAILCPTLFALLLRAPQIKIPLASSMRHLSVIIFCTHASLLYLLGEWFESLGVIHNFRWATILTLPCCFLIYLLVDFLAKRYKVFRFAY